MNRRPRRAAAGVGHAPPEPPSLIEGGLHTDERGTLFHVNEFECRGVDRFYTIRARVRGSVRGWVGHRRDSKWFSAVSGAVLVAVVQPDDWREPSADLPVSSFVLSEQRPQVLHVPPGSATALVHLTDDALLLVFSSGTIEDAAGDHYRFATTQWPVELPERF